MNSKNTNQIMTFKNDQFGSIRMMVLDGQPWFVGKDVAAALGYSEAGKAIRDHVDSEDKMGVHFGPPQKLEIFDHLFIVDDLGRKQYPTYINESGLYSLILSSKLPEAKKFKHWVTSEVIPSIRKYGGYMTDSLLDQVTENPSVIYQFAERMLQERDRANRLERELNAAKPKAQFYDSFVNPRDCTNIRNTALELGVPEKEFVRFLLRKRIFYRNPRHILVPYARGESKKMFIVRDFWKHKVLLVQTLFTPYGKSVIRDMLLASGYGVL